MDVQRTIEAAVEKRTKNVFGPPVGKKLIAFVDDMNMPRVDDYGTQQPIALLKLLFEFGGMYDRGKDLNWKLFKDICKCSINSQYFFSTFQIDFAIFFFIHRD